MNTVTISSRYQVVIPSEIREKLRLVPGQKLQAFVYAGRLELIPVRPMRQFRGYMKGIETRIERD